MSRSFSKGDSSCQSSLVKLLRNVPENRSPPLLVTTLMTPPEKRPYSAEMPELRTCVS